MRRSMELGRHLQKGREIVETRGDKWRIQFSGPRSYEHTFQYLIPEGSLDKIIEKWPDRDQVAGLDLMGSGVVFGDLGLKHGLGVALTDARPASLLAEQAGKVDVVAGNILQRQTWNAVVDWIQQRGLDDARFRLAFFRPIGGMEHILQDPSTMYALLQRVWTLMGNQNAELFVNIPHDIRKLAEAWAKKLDTTDGISAKMQTLTQIAAVDHIMTMDSPAIAMRITKRLRAPEVLPTMDFQTEIGPFSDRVEYGPKKE